jgi:glycosyltransferase involved in cell wall biosynthesis
MKFSIATPCFNSRTDLPRCVGSIRGQIAADAVPGSSFLVPGLGDFGFSVEHLVQDGLSTDGTVRWLEDHSARFNEEPRTKNQEQFYSFAYASEKDAGMYDAINKAWERSDGDVLSWLNADEQYLPGTLESVARYFAENPEVDAVFGNAWIVDGEGNPLAARREIPLRKTYITNGFLYALSCTTFFRRSLWDKGWLRLDPQYRYSSDADLVLRLLEHGVKFGHIDRFQAVFGVAGGNLSFSPAMKEESDRIKKRFGMLPSKWMRKGVMAARHVEKLVRGCYRPVPARYRFALDEVPNYREVEVASVGTRFEYDWHRPA